MFALYTTLLSANGRKVVAACRHLGLAPRIREVNVYAGEGQTAEYLAINPAGKIPTLVDDHVTLTESNAILQYVAEAYGDGMLYALDPAKRAIISSWLFWESSQWQPALIPVLAELVGHRLRPDLVAVPATPPDWSNEPLQPLLARLDAHARQSEFLAGAEPTIADLSVAGMMTYFRTADFPFSRFPGISAWYARIEALPAWRESAVDVWS